MGGRGASSGISQMSSIVKAVRPKSNQINRKMQR